MTDAQKSLINGVPVSYKATFERAYTSGSRNAAIKAFCLHCVGYLRNEVRDCTAKACPLYTHRPYQPDSPEE